MKRDKSTEDLKGRALDLAGLVGYQDGAIVSREVVSRAAGTVTVFAFDEGEQLSEHTAPFDAMVVDLDGEADIVIGGKPHRVKPGQMIIMPANISHALKAVSKFKMLLVMIKKPA
ncbi:MAG: cupin domain-containing protein [Candidatus Aminicenantes bacterium]|nr:cupin domain-containing protein [Candidatus Aminicenantes bacterium]